MLKQKIDTLILGCTHYPILKKVIGKIAGKKVKLVDSSMAVTKDAKNLLKKKDLTGNNKKAKIKFFASDEAKNFAKLAKIFLKKTIKAKKVVL